MIDIGTFATGGLFLLMGGLFLVFCRHMGENIARTRQIPREGNYPTLFMSGRGVFGIVAGTFLNCRIVMILCEVS